jgi:uncharacterized membrane protein
LAVLLGLAAALGYGLSDFVGGVVSRRVHYSLVAVIAASTALALTTVGLLVTSPPSPTAQAVLWGAASGLGGGFGGLMLYRGLSLGRMGVVAPLSALGTAALPVIVGVALGDRPSVLAWVGVVLALPAIWLVSTSDTPGEEPTTGRAPLAEGVVDGLLAGVGFAVLLIGLGLAGDGAGLWPVVAGETSSVILLVVVMIGTLRRLDDKRLSPRDVGGAALVGVLAAIGAVTYFFATHEGMLAIVAVITSLYPAATVGMSAVFLHEAITRRQGVGLALAGAAVILIAVG